MTAVLPDVPARTSSASGLGKKSTSPSSSSGRIIAIGLLASALILAFSSMRGWPFHTLTAAPWFFQLSTSNPLIKYAFLAGFYASVALFCWAWLQLLRAARANLVTRKQAFTAFGLWSVPLLLGSPLFSGDLYVYVVDGLMVARGLDPYATGVSVLGPSAEVLTVHPLWRDTESMYGPLFMRLMQGLTFLTGDNLVAGALVFRTLVFVAIGVTGVAVWNLAKRLDRAPAEAFVFAILNPLTMFHVVGGGHNDGLMLAFLVWGFAVGVGAQSWRLRMLALLLCVAAAHVKVPGLSGVLVLGWIWTAGRPLKARLLGASIAGIVGGILFAVFTVIYGLGWGWTNALDVPGLAHPLLAPANAVGLGVGGLLGWPTEVNSAARVLATVLSLILAVYFVLRTHATTTAGPVIRATGWSLLALAWLGPAVYPWYLVWGLTLIGLAGAGKLHRFVVAATIGLAFVVAPGGYGNLDLVGGLWRTVIALGLCVLLWLSVRKVLELNGFFGASSQGRWVRGESSGLNHAQ